MKIENAQIGMRVKCRDREGTLKEIDLRDKSFPWVVKFDDSDYETRVQWDLIQPVEEPQKEPIDG